MRPVNLLPGEVRRRAAVSRGSLAPYAVIGALVFVLAGVVAVILSNNQISSRKADVARLQAQEQAAKRQADSLSSFASFRTLEQQRTATIASLANSRFDWQRVLHELSIVIPGNVWLTNVTGTVVPQIQIDQAASVPARNSVPGPALELVGCAPSQNAVAAFVGALKNIDGVTRVAVQSSDKPNQATGSAPGGGSTSTGSSSGGSGDCRTTSWISKFQLVVAFDAAPTPGSSSGSPSSGSASPSGGSTGSASPSPQAQGQSASPTSQPAVSNAQQAAKIVPGH
jgi:Tfp pilus assembly protein PilN